MCVRITLLCFAAVVLCTTGSVQQDTVPGSVFKDDVFPGVGQYLFTNTHLNWTDAMKFCEGNKGELAVINSEAERNAIRIMMVKYGSRQIHLGFHDLFLDGNYVTIHDEPIVNTCSGVSQWAAGYPRDNDVYNCGGFKSDGFVDAGCDDWYDTICEYPPSSEYDFIPEFGYYKYHPENITWPEARVKCQEEGAHLYLIDSVAEREAVFKYYNFVEVWVGMHRHYATGAKDEEFYDIFNNKVVSDQAGFWYPGFPNGNRTSKPYIGTYKNGPNSYFTALYSLGRPFICEMKI